MKYDMTEPCADCPFRSDIDFHLTPERAQEIVYSMFDEDKTFACHKTTIDCDEDSGDMVEVEDSQHCAGAMILLEKNGRANQMMRICERIGLYDRSKLNMKAPVFATPEDFIQNCRKLDGR